MRRLRDKYEKDGAEGLTGAAAPRAGRHRWTGIEWMPEEHRTRHLDFNAKHFHERIKAEAEAEFEYGYTWTKTPLQKAGLIKKARRRSLPSQEATAAALAGHNAAPGRLALSLGAGLDRNFDLMRPWTTPPPTSIPPSWSTRKGP